MQEASSDFEKIFHFIFSLLLIGLSFSKALVSIAFVGLILWSIFVLFQSGLPTVRKRFLLLPTLIFFSLTLSLIYSNNLEKGFGIITSQLDFLVLPFIFFVNNAIIKSHLERYLQLFLTATSLAALLTFLFYLLPSEIILAIREYLPFLKEYVVHDKEYAFGVYSPFTERLQFSYLIVIAIFCSLWSLGEKLEKRPVISRLIPLVLQMIILIITLLILGARGAQLGFLVGMLVWITGIYILKLHPYISKKTHKTTSWFLLGSVSFMFLFLLPSLAYQNMPSVKMRYDQLLWEIGTFQDGTFRNYEYTHFTSIRRIVSWKNSWSIIKKQPILGVGVGDYQQAMEAVYARDKLDFPVNTQSQFLYFWTAAGLLGFFSFLIVLCSPLFLLSKSNNSLFKLFASSFFLFYGCIFLFDAPLNFQVGGMTFLVFYGLINLEYV